MKLLILRSAIEDISRAYDFYEKNELGLGEYFESCIYSDIESLRIYGGIHRKVHGFHRLLSKRFPYGIYYDVAGDDVRIRAVLDCRNSPSSIAGKLK